MDNFEIVLIKNDKNILVADSVEVAKNLGVNHKDLLKKIDVYVERFGSEKIRHEFYIESTFDNRGKQYRNYLITKKGIAQLIGGYSLAVPKAFDLNVAYINRFEEMEQQLQNKFKVPGSFAEALRLAAEQQEEIETLKLDNKVKDQQIHEMKPKATYYDLILQCKDLLSVTEIAKDYGMSAKTFNKKLHELGIQYKQSGVWFLYQKYASYGYTQTKTQNYNRPDGTHGVSTHMYWTQKGRLFLYDFLKNQGIIPMIEREEKVNAVV